MKVKLSEVYVRRIKREFEQEVQSFSQIDLLDTYKYYEERKEYLSQEELAYLEVLKAELEKREEEI